MLSAGQGKGDMCGITGYWEPGSQVMQNKETVLRAMTNTLKHRGPDDYGIHIESESGLGLGHRRLAIVDLSPAGHQPMLSTSGRFVMVYNGEIYNHSEIASELKSLGHVFRGSSDTEVMLAAFDRWGVNTTVNMLNGMFAFAIWDRQEKTLKLFRDRLGIKPLYYGFVGKIFVFGSELKPFKAIPGFSNPINRDALTLFLRYNYVPTPYCIYENIRKLKPGCSLSISEPDIKSSGSIDVVSGREEHYWSLRECIQSGEENAAVANDEAAVDLLHDKLKRAVKYRMMADVPLGAFLSGGIDSSVVVALMQAQSNDPVKTFSIGFLDSAFNEANFAKDVAGHLGTDHTELYVSPEDAMNVIPKLPTMFDEPFSDSSQIPTFLVSELAFPFSSRSVYASRELCNSRFFQTQGA